MKQFSKASDSNDIAVCLQKLYAHKTSVSDNIEIFFDSVLTTVHVGQLHAEF